MKDIDEVTGEIVDAAMKIHMKLGPGLLESVYEQILAGELRRRGLLVERQRRVDLYFDGICYEHAYVVDLLVERTVVVEIKSIEKTAPVHAKQVLTYLKLMDLQVGLLINFGAPFLKDGIVRLVNRYVPSASPRLRASDARS